MLGELLQRRFADAAGPADEDGYETRRKSGGDAGIRGLDVDEGDHCCDFVKGICRNESTGWCAEDQVEKYNVLPSQLRRDSKGMALGLFDINPAWHDFRSRCRNDLVARAPTSTAAAVKKSSIDPIQCFQIRFEVTAQSKPCMTLADLADALRRAPASVRAQAKNGLLE
jgi:hypothetical protein